jgi:hypothetical protein
MLHNTLVSNHFHSVKSLLFSSARPRDLDGMLCTGLPVWMYKMKTPIDMWRFNVHQLKEFLTFSAKDRYQLKYKKTNLFERSNCLCIEVFDTNKIF